MQILITGSHGFIGTNLCGLLKKDQIDFIEFPGNVLDPETFPNLQPDIIIHLASLITHTQKWSDLDYHQVNVIGTANLLSAYKTAKVVYISTTDVTKYPQTAYAKSKKRAENIVLANPKNLVIRLPSIFGPGQKQDKLIPRLIKHFYLGQACQITTNQLREYLFVDSASAGILRSLPLSGVVTLTGIKIRNNRLKYLIECIHDHRLPHFLHPDEKTLFSQLQLTCEAIGENTYLS